MNLLYIMLVIIIILFFILPIKFEIKYKTGNNDVENENIEYDSYIKIYIFNFIKIKTIKNINKKKIKKEKSKDFNVIKVVYQFIKGLYISKIQSERVINKKDFDKLLEKIKFKKLCFNLGYNLNDVVLNAYTIAIINAFFNMIIAKNIDNLNLNDTKYYTYISNKILDLEVHCILSFKLVNTINVLLKLLYTFRKVVKKDGTRTSNRKFNDDRYDFIRKYG